MSGDWVRPEQALIWVIWIFAAIIEGEIAGGRRAGFSVRGNGPTSQRSRGGGHGEGCVDLGFLTPCKERYHPGHW